MTPDIFLSYNREDAAVAQTYRDAFEREGFDVWWDATLRSGEAYDEVTEGALRGAKAVVVLWSPRSVSSRWVRAEATIAARNKTLMPVTIEPCDRPVMFELTQTAELSHWRGAADDKAWLTFLGDVRRMVGRSEPKPVESPAPPSSATGAPLVAVLPIAHRAGDDEMEILAEDLTEDITRELAGAGYFKLIAAGTMASWRGKTIDYRALGRELEARYLVEGKIQRAGEHVRLTLQLIDTGTASTLWSKRIVPTDEVLPEDLPVFAAAQLREQITQSELNRAMAKQAPLSGWDHMLRALSLWHWVHPDSHHHALEEARQAIADAPDLGLAHAVLAGLLSNMMMIGLEKLDDASRGEIHRHIKRATQLDGDNPAVLLQLAMAYGGLQDGEACLRLARRLVALDPNSPQAQYALGYACYMMGATADAIVAFRKQVRLAHDYTRPGALQILGTCLCLEGEPAEAEAALGESLALNPDYATAHKWKAVTAAQQGKEQAAKEAVMRMREAEPGMSLEEHLYATLYNPRLRERSAGAVAILRRLWAETEQGA